MSSKEKFVTLGPANGLYEHKSVPKEDVDIPSFLQDEFLSLGGIVNGILEGGAFPPYSEMPRRWREGMLIYFQAAVEPEGDQFQHITSAGIWLYRDGRWWKVIDDPSVLEFSVFVYARTADNNAPSAPTNGTPMPPDPQGVWFLTPPEKDSKAEWIWASAMSSIDVDGFRTWETPVVWSAGVVDGDQGEGGISTEFRYLAYSADEAPVLIDAGVREPVSSTPDGSENWVISIPGIDHSSDRGAVYQIQNGIDENDEVVGVWSEPRKFSTPDTTQNTAAWATAAKWGDPYPDFVQDAEGLPGTEWSYEQPETANATYPIFYTSRLEWPDGTKQTPWTIPITINAEGIPGAGFYTVVLWTLTEWPPDSPESGSASALFEDHVGRPPSQDDVLTLTNGLAGEQAWSETRLYNGTVWEKGYTIDGNLIATGTIVGNRIVSGTTIETPVLNAGTGSFLGTVNMGSAQVSSYISCGDENQFYVDNLGNVTATSATIRGHITAESGEIGNLDIVGDLNMDTDAAIMGGKTRVPGQEGSTPGGGYEDDTPGFFLGYDTDAYKFNLGDGSSFIRWNGSTLEVQGNIAFGKYIITDDQLLYTTRVSSSGPGYKNDWTVMRTITLTTTGQVRLEMTYSIDDYNLTNGHPTIDYYIEERGQFKIEQNGTQILSGTLYPTDESGTPPAGQPTRTTCVLELDLDTPQTEIIFYGKPGYGWQEGEDTDPYPPPVGQEFGDYSCTLAATVSRAGVYGLRTGGESVDPD